MEKLTNFWEKSTPMVFEKEKWPYEKKRKFRYSLQNYMHSVFNFDKFKGKKVLDVGCGSGIDSLEFARNGARVAAIDFTNNAVKSTKDLFKEAGLDGRIMKASALDLPFENNVFDCVYSFGVLHHIPKVEKALKEIHRVLKQDGLVMAMLYNRDSLLFDYSILLRSIKRGLYPKLSIDDITSKYSERIENCPYTHAYTKSEAKDLFSSFFKNIQTKVRYNVIDLPNQRKVKVNVPDKYELGWHLIVKGRK